MFDEQLTLENGTLTHDLNLLERYISYLLSSMQPSQDNSELVDELEDIYFHYNLTVCDEFMSRAISTAHGYGWSIDDIIAYKIFNYAKKINSESKLPKVGHAFIALSQTLTPHWLSYYDNGIEL